MGSNHSFLKHVEFALQRVTFTSCVCVSIIKTKAMCDLWLLQLEEGEKRYQIAWHYKIPYPRLHNLQMGTFAEKPESVTKPTYQVFFQP